MTLMILVALVILVLAALVFAVRDNGKSKVQVVAVALQCAAIILLGISMQQTLKDDSRIRKAHLEALRNEIRFNSGFLNDISAQKEKYLSAEQINLMPFQVEVYKQGAAIRFLNDRKLIGKILQFYSDLQTGNRAMELGGLANSMRMGDVTAITKRYNSILVRVAEKNVKLWRGIIEQIDAVY